VPWKNEATGIEEEKNIPLRFDLHQNYPNPFNPATTIAYQVEVSGRVILKVYDLGGREFSTLVDEEKQPGYYDVIFDGSQFSSGVYVYKIFSNDRVLSNKLILLK
jgi:hypothetical protein